MNALTAHTLDAVADLDRYPLHKLDSPEGQELIERSRSMLDTNGACQLHGFVRGEAVSRLVAEAEALRAKAHRTEDTHNIYFDEVDESLPEDDLTRRLERSAKLTVGYHRIPKQSALRGLYETDEMTQFVSAALGLDGLYRDADPAGALSYAIFERGDELGWHFDRSEFAVTLMLQPAVAGGRYEYVQNLRAPDDENRDGVLAVLDGASRDVVALDNPAGTLSLFRGRYSLHRVTPNESTQPRVNAVLAYAKTPDHRLNDLTRALFYGTQHA